MWLSIRLTQLPLEALQTSDVYSSQPAKGFLLAQTAEGSQSPQTAEGSISSQTAEGSISSQTAEGSQSPLAVIEHDLIICANQAAYQQGIKLQQSIGTAYALSDEIQLQQRNLLQEEQRLQSLAMLLYSYSSMIAIESGDRLLIEVANSLKLYSGLENLIQRLQADLDKEDIHYQIGIGHTPKSAELFSYLPLDKSLSCWQKKSQQLDINKLQHQLDKLPIALMMLPQKALGQMHSVGLKEIGELRQISQSSQGALIKRFSRLTHTYLLQLYGELADPKRYFKPADQFIQKLEFIDVVHHRQGLLFPIKRLLKDLCRFLTVKQKSSQYLRWELFDSEKNSIGFEVLVSDSIISHQIYLELTQLNLERYTLHAPIEAISLTVDKLSPLTSQTQTLFEDTEQFKQNTDFINKIRAKLGNQSCTTLQHQAEHVPELAQQITSESSTSEAAQNQQLSIAEKPNSYQQLTRPSWLLETPKPIHYNQNRLIWQGELKIISQQERITNYWWKKKVIRDYFLAEHDNGSIYWVFFEKLKKQWFIHGLYS